jgi:hypothetical protein
MKAEFRIIHLLVGDRMYTSPRSVKHWIQGKKWMAYVRCLVEEDPVFTYGRVYHMYPDDLEWRTVRFSDGKVRQLQPMPEIYA